MHDDEFDFDLTVIDFREPIAVEEVLQATKFEDAAWLAFFDGVFENLTTEERRRLIVDPVPLGLRIFSIPDEPLRDAKQSVRELIGSLIAEKLLLRLPTIEDASA